MSKERYPDHFPDLPSVTTVLGAFPGPALIGWYKKMMYSDIKTISQKGLDIGKTLHELRIRIEKGEPFEITTQYPEEVRTCLQSYFQWKKERRIVKIFSSEFPMFSEKLGYCGTLDDLAELESGGFAILEYKTNKGIYDEHIEQVIAYKNLYETFTKLTIRECWVIRFGKEKAEHEARLISEADEKELFKSFMHKLAIYNIRKRREKEWLKK